MDARARFVGFGGCSLAEGGLIAVCSWQCGFCANVLLCEVVCILNVFSDIHVLRFVVRFKSNVLFVLWILCISISGW